MPILRDLDREPWVRVRVRARARARVRGRVTTIYEYSRVRGRVGVRVDLWVAGWRSPRSAC